LSTHCIDHPEGANLKSGISFSQQGAIGIIHFNNPPLNLGTNRGLAQLQTIITDIERSDTLRVVILSASGTVFSAGSDMKEIGVHLQHGTYASEKMLAEISLRTRLSLLPVPTIAALDGSAYGGGFDWALSCDMRVAAPHIVLSLPEIDIGSFPGSGSAYRLARLIGTARAMQFILFADKLGARQALEWGVVNQIAEHGSALELAMQWAQTIANKSATGIRAVKAALCGITLPAQADLDRLQMELSAHIAESEDFKEGMQAFLEKRPPRFKPVPQETNP
jgi:enoyl-CoA hydratase/carnithine racemase